MHVCPGKKTKPSNYILSCLVIAFNETCKNAAFFANEEGLKNSSPIISHKVVILKDGYNVKYIVLMYMMLKAWQTCNSDDFVKLDIWHECIHLTTDTLHFSSYHVETGL